MRIIRFEDKRGQVQYGLDKNIVQNGVARGWAELLGGNFFVGLKPTAERAHVFRLLALSYRLTSYVLAEIMRNTQESSGTWFRNTLSFLLRIMVPLIIQVRPLGSPSVS